MIIERRRREVMLAAAGLLLGATVSGWLYQSGTLNRMARLPNKSAKIAAPSCVQLAATSAPEAGSAMKTVAASQLTVIKKDARASAGREDPTAAPAVTTAVPARRVAAVEPNYGRLIVPPPPEPAVDRPLPATPHAVSLVVKRPTADVVKLVGILDGKAFFTVPLDVAQSKHLMSTFTLGVGQQYGGITVESIGDGCATIRDGKKICTKQLGPVE